MRQEVSWPSDVENWELVSVDSYLFIIEQAKEVLDEVIGESGSITSWGMKILFAYVAGLSAICRIYIF